jgi:hypothetical protein
MSVVMIPAVAVELRPLGLLSVESDVTRIEP